MKNKEYENLKNLLIKANEAYYKNSNPIMSDYEFDQKMKELEKMEKIQGFSDSDSPTNKPGSDLEITDSSNKHKRPMLSLENTYSSDEVEKWYNDMTKACGKNPEVVVNEKWDGGSGALKYSNGKLYKALTRGDGLVGEDISQNIKYCEEHCWNKKKNFSGEARGEIIMTTKGFEELNKDGKYQNARNLLSGSLKLLNVNEFIPRASSIKFIAYWLEESKNKKYSEDLKELENYGFEVGEYYICNSLKEVMDAIEKIEHSTFDVAIDGAVMKLNDKTLWESIGSTAKYPRWAKAYKYKQESVESKVVKITFEVGRTGKITPLCWFEPVFLDGSTIQKATLNNKEFYETMDVAIGDIVTVQKAAAIIPQIISVERVPGRIPVPFPKKCPSCGSVLIKYNDEHADWYCDNSLCPCRIVDQIVNYTHMLEIDGFAEIIVERMHQTGILNSIEDLYILEKKKKQIANLDRMSLNIAEKLIKNVENSKSAELWKLLAALGIPNVGPKTAKILAKKFKSMKVIQGLTKEELVDVEDIADITADGIIKWFKSHGATIKKLEELGVKMTDESIKEEKAQIDLTGKAFCITGALSLKRDIYIDLIETCGGKVVSGVTSKTSYLITNDKTTGTKKNLEAKRLGIPVLNERELLEMCDALSLLKELQ